MSNVRHVRIPPTREIYQDTSNGTEAAAEGHYHGYTVNDDQDEAFIQFLVPHDYHGLVEATLVLIPWLAATPMTVTVASTHTSVHENYATNVSANMICSFNSGNGTLQEVDISHIIDSIAANRLKANDYVGVYVYRETGQNTNALVLGVRFRYKVFKHK